MAEFFDEFDSNCKAPSEIEAAIRSAGGYVKASDDLRPRVLENARTERCEWRARRIVWQAALFVIVLATSTSELRAPVDGHSWRLLAANSEDLLGPAHVGALSGSDVAWQLVDSLTELRRRQASAFHHSP